MKNIQINTIAIITALAAVMAATRFDHFGSAVTLPDASLAVFFLGGLYLARAGRMAVFAFVALIVEAVAIDFYVTSAQGISDWCLTPAYWFLLPTYGSLWLSARWLALQNLTQGKGLVVLAGVAWLANSFAFVLSNAAFYLLSEHFSDMAPMEYANRVSAYYGSYVSVALLYIACAIALHIVVEMLGKQKMRSSTNVA